MPKLSEFLTPQTTQTMVGLQTPMTGVSGGLISSLMTLQRQEKVRLPAIGPELAIVHEWVRTQAFNRLYLIQNLYTIGMVCSEVRTATRNIRNEVFRRGLEWIPRFESKCPTCDREFHEETKECPDCGGETIEPDRQQKENFSKFMERVNQFGQTFETVLKCMEDDVNIADDAFALILKEYIIDEGNAAVLSKPIEIYRLHPSLINFDLTAAGAPDEAHFCCPVHRSLRDKSGVCGEDGCPIETKPVRYTYLHAGTKTLPLFDDEVVHFSKFSPGTTFGFSPLLSLFEKVLTLIGMDKYVYRYFYERKMPAAMVVTATDDPESIRREREYIMSKLQNEPDYIPWVATSARTGRGKTELVRLFHTLSEMDYMPVRNEIRDRIAAAYGVTPSWMGAPTSAGGLTSQTTELVVTSRVVEGGQRIYNEDVLPRFLRAFGVTDWKLKLAQPEEKAESTRLQFAQQRAATAKMLSELGFDIRIDGKESDLDDIKFIVSGEAKKPEEQQAPGMDMAGMPGGEAPGGAPGEAPPGGAGQPQEGTGQEEGGGFFPLAEKANEEMHSHDGRPPHMKKQPHRGTADLHSRHEERVFNQEEEEDEDDEDEGPQKGR